MTETTIHTGGVDKERARPVSSSLLPCLLNEYLACLGPLPGLPAGWVIVSSVHRQKRQGPSCLSKWDNTSVSIWETDVLAITRFPATFENGKLARKLLAMRRTESGRT